MNEDVYFGQNPEYIKTLKEFCLFDDTFMTVVFENKELAELLLRIILEKPDLEVVSSKTQQNVQNLFGRSVRLDVIAKDKDGKFYNIEVQRETEYAMPIRARYNSSLLDAHLIERGEDICKLPETYIIFITEQDYFGKKQPLYKIERTILGSDELFNDGSHIIYVNGENRDDTDLGHLMSDFACRDPEQYHYKKLANEARFYKQEAKGVNTMCKLMENMLEKAAIKERKDFALKLIAKKTMSYEEISELTSLSLDEVKAIAEGATA